MSAVNAVSEIHQLGDYVTGQNEGRKDQPMTSHDLYNFAVQTDSNFLTVRGDIRNLGTVMNGEFKGVEARFDGVDNEFKLVRMEMASGFAAINARFEVVDARFIGVDARFKGIDAEFKALRAEMKEGFALLRVEIQRSNWRVSVSTVGAMIALFGIDRFWL